MAHAPPVPQNDISQQERTMAALGHGLSFVEGGIIGPAILYVIERDKSAFSAFHSLQSLLWGILMLGVTFPLIFGTIGLSFLVPIFGTLFGVGAIFMIIAAYLGFEIIATLKAYEGEWYRLPFVGRIAYRTHHP